jgi:hypothetical protein
MTWKKNKIPNSLFWQDTQNVKDNPEIPYRRRKLKINEQMVYQLYRTATKHKIWIWSLIITLHLNGFWRVVILYQSITLISTHRIDSHIVHFLIVSLKICQKKIINLKLRHFLDWSNCLTCPLLWMVVPQE